VIEAPEKKDDGKREREREEKVKCFRCQAQLSLASLSPHMPLYIHLPVISIVIAMSHEQSATVAEPRSGKEGGRKRTKEADPFFFLLRSPFLFSSLLFL
jgi:hypothetical protein